MALVKNKTKSIAKKRTKEMTREFIQAKMVFGELTFGEFYRFLCKSLHNRQPAMVLVVKEENEFRFGEEFYAHSFDWVKDEFLNLSGTKDDDGKLCFLSIPLKSKIKINGDVVELKKQDSPFAQVIRLTFFHEPQSIDVFKRITESDQ